MSLRVEVNPPLRRTLEQAAWHLTDPPQLPKGNQKERRSERRRLDLLMMRVFLIAMHGRTELLETSFPPPALFVVKSAMAALSEVNWAASRDGTGQDIFRWDLGTFEPSQPGPVAFLS